MNNLCSGYWRQNFTDEQIAATVRRAYDELLDICADKAIQDSENWRSHSNPTGCASNAQLWILGKCLGHASTFETDDDLRKRIEQKRRDG